MKFGRLLYEDDSQLLSLLSKDNEEAITLIYKKYWEQLFLSAYNVLKDRQACEDIVQEIFVQLWERRNKLSIRSSLQAYLLTATRYQVFHAKITYLVNGQIVNKAKNPTPKNGRILLQSEGAEIYYRNVELQKL